jgi:hypothetical protein
MVTLRTPVTIRRDSGLPLFDQQRDRSRPRIRQQRIDYTKGLSEGSLNVNVRDITAT